MATGSIAHLLRLRLAASSEDDELALDDIVVAAAVAATGVACSCWRSSMAATRLLPVARTIGVRKARFGAA